MSGTFLERVNVYDGIPTHGHAFPVDIADDDNVVIPTAVATTVFSINTPETGDMLICVYGRVITANTNTTVTLAWTDESGAQSAPLQSGGWAVGGHPLAIQYIHVTAGTPVSLTVTPATGNRVFISYDCFLL